LCLDCFATNLIFEDFGGFAKLEDQRAISDLLILRETWSTLDMNPLRRFKV
jgi:hypothetical protein